MTVERVDITDEILRPFAERYPFNPYRHYRLFPKPTQTNVLIAELQSFNPAASLHMARVAGAQAAVVARRLPWDSSFFNLAMARIEYVLGDHDAGSAALGDCVESLRREGVQHVSAQADAADVRMAVLLEKFGFRLTGGTLTFARRPPRQLSSKVRTFGRVRAMRDGDGPEIIALAEEAFEGFRGRFHDDPNVPRARADALYGEWAQRCVTHEMADAVFVAEGRLGRLLGFLAFRRREPVSTRSGVPIFGGGLAACRREGPGTYPALLRCAATWVHEKGGVAEIQTQSHNAAAIAIYEALGLRLRRSNYDFSLWLG